jgi:hypothetical protein
MTYTVRYAVAGLVAFVGLLVVCSGSVAQEGAGPATRTWKAGVDATVYSDYIWRGVDKYDTSVAPSIFVRFPSFEIRATGVAEVGGDADMGEVDASFEYFFSFKPVDFSVGYMFYGYDESPYSDTSEIFAKASWMTGTPIVPSLELFWDVDEADALYGRLGVAWVDHIERINYRFAARLGAATDGFSETYFFVSESGFTDFDISFNMVIPVGEYVSFEPFVGISVLLDSTVKDFVDDDTNEYVGGAIHLVF